MKPSEAMLKGFAMAGGKQCTFTMYTGPSNAPESVCAAAAIYLGSTGSVLIRPHELMDEADRALNKALGYGCDIVYINNGTAPDQEESMSIPDIAGILAAEGF